MDWTGKIIDKFMCQLRGLVVDSYQMYVRGCADFRDDPVAQA